MGCPMAEPKVIDIERCPFCGTFLGTTISLTGDVLTTKIRDLAISDIRIDFDGFECIKCNKWLASTKLELKFP